MRAENREIGGDCLECRFFMLDSTDHPIGVCRRYPRVFNGVSHRVDAGRYPEVMHGDSCGEFQGASSAEVELRLAGQGKAEA
jgi:hypothetical protein